MNKEDQTAGQKRVRVSFNPSALPIVEIIKQQLATVMDTLDEYGKQAIANTTNIDSKQAEKGDFLREVATAKTALQEASMWAVASVTNDFAFEAMKGQAPDTMVPDRWVSNKEWEEYKAYKALHSGGPTKAEV